MSVKGKAFVIKATVIKGKSELGMEKYSIRAEGSGFEGYGEGYSISSAFDVAYNDLMAKVSEAIFKE